VLQIRNIKQVIEAFEELEDMPKAVMNDAYPYLKSETPIKSGNARRKTRQKNLQIRSEYGYAGELDAGRSRQAPNGFTAPTIDYIDDLVDDYIKDL